MVRTVSRRLSSFEQLGGGHGGHSIHGGHGHGGHRDVFEDGLRETGVGHFVLAERPDDHLAHLPAGVAAHRQQRLDVLLPVERPQRYRGSGKPALICKLITINCILKWLHSIQVCRFMALVLGMLHTGRGLLGQNEALRRQPCQTVCRV